MKKGGRGEGGKGGGGREKKNIEYYAYKKELIVSTNNTIIQL